MQQRFPFPPEARLRRRSDFERVFSRAIRVADQGLIVLARPNALGRPRLGLAISRKHAGNIAARNRVKRCVRESFRLRQHRLDALDVVVLSRKGIGRLDRHELWITLDRLWDRLITRCEGSSSS